jgi:hypothetical protein
MKLTVRPLTPDLWAEFEDLFADEIVKRCPPHSNRSAVIGSTFAARRAGIQHASAATISINCNARAILSGSLGSSSNSIFSTKWVAARIL